MKQKQTKPMSESDDGDDLPPPPPLSLSSVTVNYTMWECFHVFGPCTETLSHILCRERGGREREEGGRLSSREREGEEERNRGRGTYACCEDWIMISDFWRGSSTLIFSEDEAPCFFWRGWSSLLFGEDFGEETFFQLTFFPHACTSFWRGES